MTRSLARGARGGEASFGRERGGRLACGGAPIAGEKAGGERGRYQHPEYRGRLAEMGMDCDEARAAPPDEGARH